MYARITLLHKLPLPSLVQTYARFLTLLETNWQHPRIHLCMVLLKESFLLESVDLVIVRLWLWDILNGFGETFGAPYDFDQGR